MVNPELYEAPCGYRLPNGMLCGFKVGHELHSTRWNGPEPAHGFVPRERREGIDRRITERRFERNRAARKKRP